MASVVPRGKQAGSPFCIKAMLLAGWAVLSALNVQGTEYYWTGGANEPYSETDFTPNTRTLANWALADGSVPSVKPGPSDTLVFTNKASAAADGTVFAHCTTTYPDQESRCRMLYTQIIVKDDGLVNLKGYDQQLDGTPLSSKSGGLVEYMCIPSNGVCNLTKDSAVIFDAGSCQTLGGTSKAYHENIIQVEHADASLVLDSHLAPAGYSRLVKRGLGRFKAWSLNLYSGTCQHVVEAGVYELATATKDWSKNTFAFAGDDPSATFLFSKKGAVYGVQTSLDEEQVTTTEHRLTDDGAGATLALTNKYDSAKDTSTLKDSRFTGTLAGSLSLRFDARESGATLTLAKGRSTSAGSLDVASGRVFLTDGAQYTTLTSVTVGGVPGFSATLTVDGGATLAADALSIEAGGTLDLAAGEVVLVRSFTVGGVEQETGVYTQASGVGISGEGCVRVLKPVVVAFDASTKVASAVDFSGNPAMTHEMLTATGAPLELALSERIAVPDATTNRIAVAEFALGSGIAGEDLLDVSPKTTGLPFTWFEVVEEGGKLRAYLVSRPVVTADAEVRTDASRSYYFMKEQDKSLWSDGQVPHAGADYLIAVSATQPSGAKLPIFYDDVENGEKAFPGETLTLDGARYEACNSRFSVDLRLYNMSADQSRRVYGVSGKSLSGTMFVDASSQLVVVTDPSTTFALHSKVYGPGKFQLDNMWTASTDGTYLLYGDLSALAGSVSFKGSYNVTKDVRKNLFVVITNATALGGAMAERDPAGLVFNGFPLLRVDETATFDAANREVHSLNGARIEVAAGKTFAVKNPINCSMSYTASDEKYYPDRCCIEKTGAGVLALGAVVRPCDASLRPAAGDGRNNLVRVKEGGVQPLAENVFDNLAVEFGDGAEVVFDPENAATAAYGLRMLEHSPVLEDGAAIGVAAASGSVVRVGVPYPFLTVPESTPDLLPRISAGKVLTAEGTRRGMVACEYVTVGNVGCARYSVMYPRAGTLVFIR